MAVLVDLFECMNVRAVGATGAAAALEYLAREDAPGAIVTDLSMPHVDGWMLIDRLRADERTRHIPVVVLTAHADDGTRLRAEAAGATYFSKPFLPQPFIATIRRLIYGQPTFDRRERGIADSRRRDDAPG